MIEKPAKLPRAKTCRGCGVKFQPVRPLQIACCPECAYKVARINGGKKRAAQYRADKKRLKSRADYVREAQAAINKYCRLRDAMAGHGCISCGTHNGKQNGGHYKSVGSSPETRFLPENISLQCERCNSFLSGNIINYRLGLIARYGAEYVEKLEGPHPANHYSIEEIESIKMKYSKMARDLEKQQ